MSSNHTQTRGPGASKRAVRRVAGGLAAAALLAAPSPALAHDSFTARPARVRCGPPAVVRLLGIPPTYVSSGADL